MTAMRCKFLSADLASCAGSRVILTELVPVKDSPLNPHPIAKEGQGSSEAQTIYRARLYKLKVWTPRLEVSDFGAAMNECEQTLNLLPRLNYLPLYNDTTQCVISHCVGFMATTSVDQRPRGFKTFVTRRAASPQSRALKIKIHLTPLCDLLTDKGNKLSTQRRSAPAAPP